MSIPTTPIDPQKLSVFDDGTAEGVTRAALVSGGLVPVLFRGGHFTSQGSTVTHQRNGLTYNAEIGAMSGISVSVAAGGFASVKFPFYGRKFGLVWRSISGVADMYPVIDGVQYDKIPGYDSFLTQNSISIYEDPFWVVSENLPQTPGNRHWAEIHVPGLTSGTNAVVLLAFLADSAAGYRWPLQNCQLGISGATPTSWADVASESETGAQQSKILKTFYHNTTGGALRVEVRLNSTVFWSKSIAAGDSEECTYCERFPFGFIDSILEHQAAGAGVNYTHVTMI